MGSELWLQAATGVIDLARLDGICLAGFAGRTGPAKGVDDSLELNALLLSSDHRRVDPFVIVSGDLLYFGAELRDAVRGSLSDNGLDPERFLLLADHTHYEPATDDSKSKLGAVGSRFVTRLATSVADVVMEARQSACPRVHAPRTPAGRSRNTPLQVEMVFPEETAFRLSTTSRLTTVSLRELYVQSWRLPTGMARLRLNSRRIFGTVSSSLSNSTRNFGVRSTSPSRQVWTFEKRSEREFGSHPLHPTLEILNTGTGNLCMRAVWQETAPNFAAHDGVVAHFV